MCCNYIRNRVYIQSRVDRRVNFVPSHAPQYISWSQRQLWTVLGSTPCAWCDVQSSRPVPRGGSLHILPCSCQPVDHLTMCGLPSHPSHKLLYVNCAYYFNFKIDNWLSTCHKITISYKIAITFFITLRRQSQQDLFKLKQTKFRSHLRYLFF